MSLRGAIEVECTVRASNTPDDLSAHVELAGGIELGPGDRVLVHGDAIAPAFGETLVLHRRATVVRASLWRRLWTRITGDLGCLELVEVSFSDRSTT